MLTFARLLYECDAVATGHYARVAASVAGDVGAHSLLRGADPTKDQSYFLYGLGQDELAHTQFPLGEMTKVEVRDAARALGLATAEKRDSQEICFVPRGDYRDVLRERGGWTAEPGPVIDVDGRQVGEHHGAASYTIGQRQGTGASVGEARYVRQIDPGSNTIVLGRRADLETRCLEVGEVKFVAGNPPTDAEAGSGAEVQTRHRGRAAPATIRQANEGPWLAATDDPAGAAAPGQAAVFYRGEVVMGGGRIARPADSVAG